MSAYYRRVLDHILGATLQVEFTTERREVVDYAVVLLFATPDGTETVRATTALTATTRCTATPEAGKHPGTPFHSGTLGDGMRAAIEQIEGGYREMIEGWQRQ